jgi:hypothetical protein
MSPFMLSAEAPLREKYGADLEEKLQARAQRVRARGAPRQCEQRAQGANCAPPAARHRRLTRAPRC